MAEKLVRNIRMSTPGVKIQKVQRDKTVKMAFDDFDDM